MKYSFQTTVRGYELDSFSHVNHAVYLNYCEQARWEILNSRDLFSYFLDNKLKLVVIDAHIRYINEAKIFDILNISTTLERNNPYIVFKHSISENESGKRIARATIKSLLIDEDKIPMDIPDVFFEENV